MNLAEIKCAVRAGHKVYWKSPAYEVRLIETIASEQWLIVCVINQNAIGLTWTDGTTLNGAEFDFFTVTASEEEILAGREVKYRDGPMVVVPSELSANWPEHVDFYRVIDLMTGDESALYSMAQCKDIIALAKREELMGSFAAWRADICNQLQNGGAHG